jgi:transposase-like protein
LKQYQISRNRAVQELKKRAAEVNPPVQMVIPLAEIVSQLQSGMKQFIGTLLRIAMEETMQQEVTLIAGDRSCPNADRKAYRWGTEQGYCVVQGQKLHIGRPRILAKNTRKELPLGSYELFQRACLMEDAVWAQMMRQVSTRKYSDLVQQFAETYGVKKSAISDHFIACSRQKLQQLLQRSLDQLSLCAMFIDSIVFKSQNLVSAIGLNHNGHKVVLGLWQGATENCEVVRALLADLQQRGLDFNVPRLYVIDGSRSLRKAVEQVAGSAAAFQRCQVHKIRNVTGHLVEGYNYAVRSRMHAAYACADYSEAKSALSHLHDELQRRSPSAAKSLAEGLEETLTVHKLRVPYLLRKTMATTNPIESAFSVVEKICSNVKQWSAGDQRLRWVASALLYAESRFRRPQGSFQIPFMIKELELLTLKQGFKMRSAGAA